MEKLKHFWIKEDEGWTKAIMGIDGTPNRLGNGRRVPTYVPNKGYRDDTLWVMKWDAIHYSLIQMLVERMKSLWHRTKRL